MLYCPEPYQTAVTDALEGAGLLRMAYRFEHGGAQVLTNALARPVVQPASRIPEAQRHHA